MTTTTETPTLAERAIDAYRAAVIEADEASSKREAAEIEKKKNLLADLLLRHLDIHLDDDALRIHVVEGGVVRATYQGLIFGAWRDRDGDPVLAVERQCVQCGLPVFVEFCGEWHHGSEGLERLGGVLSLDDHVHRYGCPEPEDRTAADAPAIADAPRTDYEIVESPEVARLQQAAQALGEARAHEMALEDGRWAEWQRAILRLMEAENPLTGKMHSVSSAERVIESDEGYAAYRQHQRDAVVAVQVAHAEYEAAKAALHRQER